jgi:acetyltransferase-like isoleucine patch superfamily enzyme
MSDLPARILFRLRALARAHLVERPRTLAWRAAGLRTGAGTLLPAIHVTWPHQVAFGARCVVEPGSAFKFDGIYRPGPAMRFGDGVFIGRGCEFNIRRGLVVGANGLIASGCRFIDHDHGFADRTVPMNRQADGAELPIEIGEDVWIGANAVVLKGVTIGRGAIIAAGSVLTRSVGAHEIWGGVPARKLRDRPLKRGPAGPSPVRRGRRLRDTGRVPRARSGCARRRPRTWRCAA